MERYSGDFLAAVDGLRALLGCRGRVWPVSVEQASRLRRVRRRLDDARRSRGGCRASRRGHVRPADLARAAGRRFIRRSATAIRGFDAVDHRSGQLLHEPDADLPRARRGRGARGRERARSSSIANLLTEGRGMTGFTAADAVRADRGGDRAPGRRRHRQHEVARRRRCSSATRAEHKEPLAARQLAGALRSGRRGVLVRATSPATIAGAWRTRCGASSRSALLALRRQRLALVAGAVPARRGFRRGFAAPASRASACVGVLRAPSSLSPASRGSVARLQLRRARDDALAASRRRRRPWPAGSICQMAGVVLRRGCPRSRRRS